MQKQDDNHTFEWISYERITKKIAKKRKKLKKIKIFKGWFKSNHSYTWLLYYTQLIEKFLTIEVDDLCKVRIRFDLWQWAFALHHFKCS